MKASIKNLLTAVRDGKSYIGNATTYEAAMGAGFLIYVDAGCSHPETGYRVTDAGKAALSAIESKAAIHARNCRCPRCQMQHAKNGCRAIHCPVCN